MTNNLRSVNGYRSSAPDWTPFNVCFPRGIHLMDIDGFVEVGRHFLFQETKPTGFNWETAAHAVRGQFLALQRLAELPCHLVIVLYGPGRPMAPVEWEVLGSVPRRPCRLQEVQDYVAIWSAHADACNNRNCVWPPRARSAKPVLLPPAPPPAPPWMSWSAAVKEVINL